MSRRPSDDDRVYFLGADGRMRSIPASELFDSLPIRVDDLDGERPAGFHFSVLRSPVDPVSEGAAQEAARRALAVVQRFRGDQLRAARFDSLRASDNELLTASSTSFLMWAFPTGSSGRKGSACAMMFSSVTSTPASKTIIMARTAAVFAACVLKSWAKLLPSIFRVLFRKSTASDDSRRKGKR